MKTDKQFHTWPHPVFLVLIPAMMFILTPLVAYRVDLLPTAYMGPLGSLCLFMNANLPRLSKAIFWLGLGVHVVEGILAYRMARKHKLSSAAMWGVSVFIYGVFSFRHLTAHVKDSKAR